VYESGMIKTQMGTHSRSEHGRRTWMEMRYSSASFLTSALDRVSGQRHAPAALYPLKGPLVPIVQEAGWAPEPVWTHNIGLLLAF
jgi:hypothetical protein